MAATTDDLMAVLLQIVKIMKANAVIATLPPASSRDPADKTKADLAVTDLKNA